MRIVHFVQFGPRACGLYETAKDLIRAERQLGADALLVDMDERGESRVGLRDGALVTVAPEAAYDADVLVRHSAIPSRYQTIGVPIVMCLHGRPESSYRLSAETDNDVIQAVANKGRDARYRAFVTFWAEYAAFWRSLVGDTLHVVPAPVDLEYYAGGLDRQLSGSYRILIADVWRQDMIPLHSILGVARYIEKYDSDARIHLVGLPTTGRAGAALQPILRGLSQYIGSAAGHMKNVRDWYASCDCLVTPHTIATRVIRESLAASLPVVANEGCKTANETAACQDADAVAEAICRCRVGSQSRAARALAERHFDASRSAEAMIEVCCSVCNNSPRSRRRLFVDIGAHHGESVRKFFRERRDAEQFDIFAFEPDPQALPTLFANVGACRNVAVVNAAFGAAAGPRTMYRAINAGEGTTACVGKQTGGVDYHNSFSARMLCLADWLDAHPADETIVKMNIEGGEYELLPHLVETGTLSRIDVLHVHMHAIKFDLGHRIKMDAIEQQFRQDAVRFKTKIVARTKGWDSFAQ